MVKPVTLKNIVFYADDDADDLELVQDAFDRYSNNVKVVTAKDGVQALSYLQSLNEQAITPCLIILDINMPIVSGWECLSQFKSTEHLKEIRVIMFTTSSQERERDIAKQLGADGFITKPSEYKTLKELLSSVVNT